MGIFGKIIADRCKYKAAYRLSQTLHPHHSRIWADRIVKMPDNPYAFTGTGTLISSDDMYPYAVYSDYPPSEGIVAEVLAGGQFWAMGY